MKKRKQNKGGLELVSAINEQEAEEKHIRILNANFKEAEIEIHLARKEPMSPERAASAIRMQKRLLEIGRKKHMKTKEEILRAMKICSSVGDEQGQCSDCPYVENCEDYTCSDVMMRDAIALIEGDQNL